MSLIIVKSNGLIKNDKFFCQTISYKERQRKYILIMSCQSIDRQVINQNIYTNILSCENVST
jgi:hypothetical protein